MRISDWSSDVCSSDLSRLDTGWRDGIDLPLGESRELYRVATLPAVAGVGPWEPGGASLSLDAAMLAALPPGTALDIRQVGDFGLSPRSEEHTSELQSLMRNSYAVLCLKKKKKIYKTPEY